MKVISAAAQQNNGKDELCNYLVELLHESYAERWRRSAFADKVKETFCESFGVDRAFIEKWKRVDEAPEGFLMPIRQALQFIGDGFRNIKEKIWIEIALRGDANLVISDSRYVNEAKAVREVGGVNILVFRPGFINYDKNPSEAQLRPLIEFAAQHFTDGPIMHDIIRQVNGPTDLAFYDFFLVNEGTLHDFKLKIEKVLLPWIAKRLELT